MKQFALLALFIAGVAANGGGWGPGVPSFPSLARVQPAPYAAPLRSDSYGPALRTNSYAPALRTNSYEPALRTNSYEPALRTNSYSSNSYGSSSSRFVPITRFNHEIRGSQSDSVSYETGNGISVSDDTQIVAGRGAAYDDGYGKMVQSNSVVKKQGAYSYTAPDGQRITTTWVADENGFRAEGAHLPRPVEMPAEHAEAHRLALSRVSGYGNYAAPTQSFIRSSRY
ncbi:Endocuticle structural glycoprotein SgAbd-2 [Orchesella cincta]|uniref:Endocuticle structural glycoprotein SgAbd-2 n=1 Tax=Orchesella cincta TaxID=48709 RepID=A0A1D2MGT1_ORCCI|nr:Endocuticle structural glycoprotein SgAbd-2 [Orchesella cincta]